MLKSTEIQRRQSEIRQSLAELAGQETLTDETRSKIDTLDNEFQDNERRYRAALVAESEEREKAKGELEARGGNEWAELVRGYELRQAALFLDEGRTPTGQTAEVMQEMRNAGGYRGCPVPLEALEVRNTVSGGTPNPMDTMPIVDRLFAPTVAGRMGVATVNIAQGEREYPVVSSSITAGWAASEGGDVATGAAFETTDKALAPDSTFGVQLRVTRKAMKQSGAGLEAAMRRDMLNAMQVGLDKAVFLGSGTNGEPLGIIPGAATYGITSTAIDAVPTYGAFRKAVVRFMQNNAVASPTEIRALIRPETWDELEAQAASTAAPKWEWDRLVAAMGAGNLSMTTNALEAPSGSPAAASAILATTAGGLPPAFMAIWGGVDLIRDPYTDAASGGLRLTGLVTSDVTVARGSQVEILTGLEESA
jgi:HK97 family phage major capsid protein